MRKATRKISRKDVTCDFFAISCLRLYLLSFFSFGLYELYWAYKNWLCVKDAKQALLDEKIHPVLRGWFLNFIWFLPLCVRIVKRYGANVGRYIPLAAVYLVCFYAAFFCLDSIVVFVLLRLVTPLFLLPLQRLINKNSSHLIKFGIVDFIVPFIGLILMIFAPFFYRVSEINSLLDMEKEKQQNFFAVSGIIYRYTIIYNEVCGAQGVSLDAYQQTFNESFAEEIGIVKQILKKAGISFDEFMEAMLDDDVKEEAYKTVVSEIEKLRKFFILHMLSQNGDKSKSYEDWDDAYDGYLSQKEACELINGHADAVIKILGVDRTLKFYTDNL